MPVSTFLHASLVYDASLVYRNTEKLLFLVIKKYRKNGKQLK